MAIVCTRHWLITHRQRAHYSVAVVAVAETGCAKTAGVREDTRVVALNGLPCFDKDCVQAQLQSVDAAQLALVSWWKQPLTTPRLAARATPPHVTTWASCSGVCMCLAKCAGHVCAFFA